MQITLASTILFCLFIISLFFPREGFATKRDKAQYILNWYNGFTTTPSYTDYRRAIPDPIFVDYEATSRLFRAGQMTIDDVEKNI